MDNNKQPVQTTLYLPDELYEVLRRWAFDHRKSMSEVIRAAIKEYIERNQDEPV